MVRIQDSVFGRLFLFILSISPFPHSPHSPTSPLPTSPPPTSHFPFKSATPWLLQDDILGVNLYVNPLSQRELTHASK
ncbi:MAG: hypothetical protein EWV60_08655 [Microcystis sp. Msp_OC_L_20101000_S702]|nr:MAG: hypothetical protein EWV60_08655 [Microcystis sp. Msp_OC_L_20101000_S702]